MTSRCDHTRLLLGAYALGTLEPAEQQTVERHLASCPACTAETDELAAVVPILSTVSRDDVSAEAPSPDLFARIVSAIDSPTPTTGTAPAPAATGHKPRRWLLAAAASVVLLAGAGAGTAIGVSLSSSHPTSTTASASSGGVSLRVTARDAATGTLLDLVVVGLPRNEHCHLVASAADGSRHDAGSWNATYDGQARITELTDVPRAQLRRLTLYGSAGQRLVTVTV